jgi:hypothetical protein
MNLAYIAAYDNRNSAEFLRFTEEVASTVSVPFAVKILLFDGRFCRSSGSKR